MRARTETHQKFISCEIYLFEKSLGRQTINSSNSHNQAVLTPTNPYTTCSIAIKLFQDTALVFVWFVVGLLSLFLIYFIWTFQF